MTKPRAKMRASMLPRAAEVRMTSDRYRASKPSTSLFTVASFSLKVNFMFGMSMSRSAFTSATAFFRYFTPSYSTFTLSAWVTVLSTKRSWLKSPLPVWSKPARSITMGSVASS